MSIVIFVPSSVLEFILNTSDCSENETLDAEALAKKWAHQEVPNLDNFDEALEAFSRVINECNLDHTPTRLDVCTFAENIAAGIEAIGSLATRREYAQEFYLSITTAPHIHSADVQMKLEDYAISAFRDVGIALLEAEDSLAIVDFVLDSDFFDGRGTNLILPSFVETLIAVGKIPAAIHVAKQIPDEYTRSVTCDQLAVDLEILGKTEEARDLKENDVTHPLVVKYWIISHHHSLFV